MSAAQRRRAGFRVDRGLLRALVVAAVALAALVGARVAAEVYAPRVVATTAELEIQRTSAERAIQRIYAEGIGQLKTTRGLRLAITDAQAAVIEERYAGQMRDLRRSALQAIGEAYGMAGDAGAQYAQQAAARLDQAVPSSAPVMLAPRLYAIVERMGQLTSQLSDRGVREMTQTTPAGSPAPSPSPSPTGR